MDFRINKKCNTCQSAWAYLPVNKAKAQKDFNDIFTIGFHFDCTCGSTLFVKIENILIEINKKEVA